MIPSTTKIHNWFAYTLFTDPIKNSSIMDLNNDHQKAYAFATTYGDGSTAFHFHMISVDVFSYSNILQIMLVYYTVTDMGCFD